MAEAQAVAWPILEVEAEPKGATEVEAEPKCAMAVEAGQKGAGVPAFAELLVVKSGP